MWKVWSIIISLIFAQYGVFSVAKTCFIRSMMVLHLLILFKIELAKSKVCKGFKSSGEPDPSLLIRGLWVRILACAGETGKTGWNSREGNGNLWWVVAWKWILRSDQWRVNNINLIGCWLLFRVSLLNFYKKSSTSFFPVLESRLLDGRSFGALIIDIFCSVRAMGIGDCADVSDDLEIMNYIQPSLQSTCCYKIFLCWHTQ